MTATGANDGERLLTIDPSERAALYTRRAVATDYEQAFGGFLNRVSEVRVLQGAPDFVFWRSSIARSALTSSSDMRPSSFFQIGVESEVEPHE